MWISGFSKSHQRERGSEGSPPCPSCKAGRAGKGFFKIAPSVGRSVGRIHAIYRDTAPRENMESSPRLAASVFHHAILIWHPATRPRWGAGTARPLAAVSFRAGVLAVSFPIFCSSGSGLIFRLRPRVPRLPRAGPYDIAASPRDCPGVRITPPPSSARAYAEKSCKAAKRPQDLALQDFSAYAIPYHQGVIRTPRRACPRVAFYFR